MKRFLITLMAAALLVGSALAVTSCSNIDLDRFDVDEFIENAESDGSIRVPVYGVAEGTTVTIMDAAPFSDGVALIYIHEETVKDGYKTYRQYTVAVNPSGKIVYAFSPLATSTSLLLEPHQNGVAMHTTSHTLYDTNLEIIASPEKTGYDKILAAAFDRGLFLVTKTEERFEGDVILFGIINNKGDYVEPLSADHVLAKAMNEKGVTPDDYSFGYVGNGVISITKANYSWSKSTIYYHLLTDKLTEQYDHYEVYEQKLLKYFEDPEKEYETVIQNPDYVEAVVGSNFLIRSVDPDTGNETYSLKDQNLKTLLDFGTHQLTAQTRNSSEESSFYYQNGYFLTQVENSTGGLYCCLYTPTGELAFEPIRMDKYDHFYALSEDGFVFKKSNEKTFYFVDYAGNMRAFDTDYNFIAGTSEFSDGLACVSSLKGWVYINLEGKIIISGETLAAQIAH